MATYSQNGFVMPPSAADIPDLSVYSRTQLQDFYVKGAARLREATAAGDTEAMRAWKAFNDSITAAFANTWIPSTPAMIGSSIADALWNAPATIATAIADTATAVGTAGGTAVGTAVGNAGAGLLSPILKNPYILLTALAVILFAFKGRKS